MENKNPKIFLITGKARHGKDTIADIILAEYEKRNKKTLRLAYGSYIKMYAKNISDWDGAEETKPRELLQTLGTELVRDKIDELFFVNRICEDIKIYSYFFDALIVRDVRMRNEIEIPEAMFNNVVKMKVIRSDFETVLTKKQQIHRTEHDLDDYNDYDYVIINDGTIDDLKKKIIEIVEVIENEH